MGLPVIVYGAGGLGREVMQMARAALDPGEYHALGYVDDGISAGTVLNGYPVLGGGEYLENSNENIALVLGIADPEIKAGIFRRFKDKNNITFPNVIHPSALVSEYAALGRGVVAAQGSLISVDAVIGDCVFINYGATIGHDVSISGFSSVMPLTAISGWVKIGERCLIGAQSAIRQSVSVGGGATVGMGSVVLSDVPGGTTVAGNPAKRIS